MRVCVRGSEFVCGYTNDQKFEIHTHLLCMRVSLWLPAKIFKSETWGELSVKQCIVPLINIGPLVPKNEAFKDMHVSGLSVTTDS